MIVLSRIKRVGLDDLGVDGARREFRFDLFLGVFSEFLLVLGAIENRGAVLIARVAELLILHQRIDVAPEYIEQLRVGDLGGIVGDFDRLGVTGAAGRYLLVGRIL